MDEYFKFEKVESSNLEYFRNMQIKELRGHVQDFIEEGIVTYKADFINIIINGETAGYACIGTYEYYKDSILEFYMLSKYRNKSGEVLKQLAMIYDCREWFVNTQDSFTLPIMLDFGLEFETDAYIFGANSSYKPDYEFDRDISFKVTVRNELNEVYELIMQDGFYTGGGIETLEPRTAGNELYSLRKNGQLIGVGFVDILERTPNYADIAMIIASDERHRRLGVLLVKALISECRFRNIIPTAVCHVDNNISRKTLQGAGFQLEGCMLLAKLKF